MEQKKTNNKRVVLGIAILVVLVAALLIVWNVAKPSTVEGSKQIALEVVYEDGTTEDYTINTDAEYLKEAIEDTVTLDGEVGDYGYTLYTVNGVTADWADNVYWAIYVNGEYGMYALDQQPVADGDSFQLVYEGY
jgi:hypothetical protein